MLRNFFHKDETFSYSTHLYRIRMHNFITDDVDELVTQPTQLEKENI